MNECWLLSSCSFKCVRLQWRPVCVFEHVINCMLNSYQTLYMCIKLNAELLCTKL